MVTGPGVFHGFFRLLTTLSGARGSGIGARAGRLPRRYPDAHLSGAGGEWEWTGFIVRDDSSVKATVVAHGWFGQGVAAAVFLALAEE